VGGTTLAAPEIAVGKISAEVKGFKTGLGVEVGSLGLGGIGVGVTVGGAGVGGGKVGVGVGSIGPVVSCTVHEKGRIIFSSG
jgi:hypothetical protein